MNASCQVALSFWPLAVRVSQHGDNFIQAAAISGYGMASINYESTLTRLQNLSRGATSTVKKIPQFHNVVAAALDHFKRQNRSSILQDRRGQACLASDFGSFESINCDGDR